MNLFYRTLGVGKPLIILHGLFGSSDNWMALARSFADRYEVLIPDLRNHGRSPHSEHWEYEAMVGDIHQLVSSLKLKKVTLVGHSMGGKVAMVYADRYRDAVEKLLVVDIAPRQYAIRHRAIVDALMRIELKSTKSRKEVEKQLLTSVPEWRVRQFLLKNLDRDSQQNFRWKINLPVISRHLDNVGLPTYPQQSVDVPTLFIRGIKSDYVTDDDIMKIRSCFSDVAVETIGNAGHWVHAEQPEAFLNTVNQFLGNDNN